MFPTPLARRNVGSQLSEIEGLIEKMLEAELMSILLDDVRLLLSA